MQDLFLLKNNMVYISVESLDLNYQDALDNFKLDSGLQINYKHVDYNRTVGQCLLNNEEFQEYPNQFFENILNNIQTYIDAKEKRGYKEPTFEEKKQDKSDELSRIVNGFENNLNKNMYFTSSLGFKVNGDRRTRDNLQDIINFIYVQAKNVTIKYRDYDNEWQKLTNDQVQLLLSEHVINYYNLYNQKWHYKELINNAQTKEDLEQINLEFNMMDFTT